MCHPVQGGDREARRSAERLTVHDVTMDTGGAPMPAITAHHTLVLPRIHAPAAASPAATPLALPHDRARAEAARRPVQTVVNAHHAVEGAGFELWRPFPGKV